MQKLNSFNEKPEVPGIYKIKRTGSSSVPFMWSHWNGNFWSYACGTEKEAFNWKNSKSTDIYEGCYNGWYSENTIKVILDKNKELLQIAVDLLQEKQYDKVIALINILKE